jgi:hypothetical protein
MKKSVQLTDALIQEAWNFLWSDNLKRRKAQERKGDTWRIAETFYLTAADVDAQVRHFVIEDLDGKKRGSTGRACGRPWRPLRAPGLYNRVRDWLLRNPALTHHNFGRGHISGARFRPVGQPISPTEKETLRRHEVQDSKPRPRHYSKSGHYGSRPLCSKPRSGWLARPSKAYTTSDREKVTCPRCKNLLADLPAHKQEGSQAEFDRYIAGDR